MLDAQQISRMIQLVCGGLLLWAAITAGRDYVVGVRDMRRVLRERPRYLEHYQAQYTQREALLELGFNDIELANHSSVAPDPETGWTTTTCFIPRAAIEARAA
ncbi:MAG: hypothetical protein J2P17_28585, partial [Mycobacterium sp.]|nr:hypothetical protein [Mycobacterium sp.]